MNHGAKTRPWIIMWLLGVSHARMKQLYWVPAGSLSKGLSRKGCHHAVPPGQQGHGWSCQCCTGDIAQWDIPKSGSAKLLEDAMQNIHWIWLLVWHIPESCNCLNPIFQVSSLQQPQGLWTLLRFWTSLLDPDRRCPVWWIVLSDSLRGSGNKKETESFLIRED